MFISQWIDKHNFIGQSERANRFTIICLVTNQEVPNISEKLPLQQTVIRISQKLRQVDISPVKGKHIEVSIICTVCKKSKLTFLFSRFQLC